MANLHIPTIKRPKKSENLDILAGRIHQVRMRSNKRKTPTDNAAPEVSGVQHEHWEQQCCDVNKAIELTSKGPSTDRLTFRAAIPQRNSGSVAAWRGSSSESLVR